MNSSDTHPNRQLIDGLREFAGWLEANPMPCLHNDHRFCAFPQTADDFRAAVLIVGTAKKEILADWFMVVKKFGPLTLELCRERKEVCERVKVGEKVIPASEEKVIPETVIPARPEHVEEIFEWRCPDSLLAEKP